MKPQDIAGIVNTSHYALNNIDDTIVSLLTDSRKLTNPSGCLFFAIRTRQGNGCKYVDELYHKGVRNFVVPEDFEVSLPEANVWNVSDVVASLQRLASAHRGLFDIPVVGITGSNGKTVVKDWLVQLMADDYRICANPKSYNSQIGVPLSVWQLSKDDTLAIFEAGISEPGEMARLQRVIRPTIGIFTNVGSAHDENFLTRGQKIAEKLQLFTHCDILVYCADHKDIHSTVSSIETFHDVQRFTWGTAQDNDVQLVGMSTNEGATTITYSAKKFGHMEDAVIPFIDRASQENAMHCITLMVYLGYNAETIRQRLQKLTPVEMRMEMIEATSGSLLINDSYSLDMGSLSIALDTLQSDRRHLRHTLIMSDLMQTGIPESDLYSQVADLLRHRGVGRIIAIGPALSRSRHLFDGMDSTFYESTEDFLQHFDRADFSSETILLKGARVFGFERIAKLLQRRTHETILEVNIDALVSNLSYYRSRLNPGTRLMAMVKAASYGAGKVEVATALQWRGVDYLTVAYADEGVELRRGGITLPIMVMNPEEAAFDDIIRYNLEPDIYSFRILNSFAERASLLHVQVPIHIEFDTGMHRLGYDEADIDRLAERLNAVSGSLKVRSIFSHLACSEDPAMDDFTHMQLSRFREWSGRLKSLLPNPDEVLCHILNSSGITRFPEAQMDMVRLGIGLYGISPEPEVQAQLREVSRLVTRISQIKNIPVGDSVGYNRAWTAERPTRLAILPIGYADGLNRHLGGTGHVLISGKAAPIVGKVCMDMCFVDVTDVPCSEGDRAVIFGEGDLLESNAAAAGTISYEILTSVAPRVKRVYVQEG